MIDTTDYHESFHKNFSDTTKIKKLDANLTITRLGTLQSYDQMIYDRNEISEQVYQKILPKKMQK